MSEQKVIGYKLEVEAHVHVPLGREHTTAPEAIVKEQYELLDGLTVEMARHIDDINPRWEVRRDHFTTEIVPVYEETEVERLQALLGEYREVLKPFALAALTASKAQVETITQAAILLREASDFARQRALEQVQGLTSSALQSVFGPTYQFRLESGESAGRPTVTCQVVTPFGDGDSIATEGTDSRGGGTIDIQALALRWAMLETHRPGIDGPLILDEPAKHVSEEYVGPTGRFLRGACDTFGRQVIMVTHNPALAGLADQVVQVSMVDGASRVQ